MEAVAANPWTRRATWLAWGTIAWNVLEGAVSVGFGLSEESLALLGFGLDSWVEVGSAVVVLLTLSGRAPERRASKIVSGLLVALGTLILLGGIARLGTHAVPQSTLPGLVISVVSLSFMFALYKAKLAAAEALNSRTLRLDAMCSKGCIQLSAVLLAGSLVYLAAPALWWADPVAALVLGGMVLREGKEGWSAKEGCGCGCSCGTE